MPRAEQKIVQYLNEAHATEMALVRVLQSQIAMTPRGRLRDGLERHLDETRSHADRVRSRLREIDGSANPLQAWIGFTETIVGQTIALTKTPFDLLRGTGGEEKLLKNVKDDCATEALEIATYTALEHVARSVGDETTARLAASIRKDEERMLARLMDELPKLAQAVVRADVKGDGSFDVTTTGAADTAREAVEETARTARRTAGAAKRTTGAAGRAARSAAGHAQPPTADDLPINKYDELNADEVTSRLSELSQAELRKVEAYERAHAQRSTVLERIDAFKGDEPWRGFDEQSVEEIRKRLSDSDDDTAAKVRDYERRHKQRAGVVQAAERELATA